MRIWDTQDSEPVLSVSVLSVTQKETEGLGGAASAIPQRRVVLPLRVGTTPFH